MKESELTKPDNKESKRIFAIRFIQRHERC